MKKLGGLMVSMCALAALTAGPAHAATPVAPALDNQELCAAAFGEERCENLARQWANVLADRDPAEIDRFARGLLADVPNGRTTCRAIFSDQVCDELERNRPQEIIDKLPTVDGVRYLVLWLADCVVHQTCITIDPGNRSDVGGSVRVCREVFADGICSRVEDPVGTVVWLYETYVRCLLDPACTPTPNIWCNQHWCIRGLN